MLLISKTCLKLQIQIIESETVFHFFPARWPEPVCRRKHFGGFSQGQGHAFGAKTQLTKNYLVKNRKIRTLTCNTDLGWLVARPKIWQRYFPRLYRGNYVQFLIMKEISLPVSENVWPVFCISSTYIIFIIYALRFLSS